MGSTQPDLDNIRDKEQSNWDEYISPDDWMRPLNELLRALDTYFQEEQDVINLVDEQLSMVENWIVEHTEIQHERRERLIGSVDIPIIPQSARSIFDDIDAE